MTRRERQRRRARNKGSAARPVFLFLGLLATVAVIGALGAVGWVIGIAASAPSIKTLKPAEPGSTSVVYAADGTRLGFIASDILRTPVPQSDVPVSVRNATVAIEDRRFYKHKGVDFQGIVRAAFKNVQNGQTVQGGSTLTMQLVKVLYDGGKKRTFDRKIQEAKLAEDLENIHPGIGGKRWILTKYVNEVPYGTVGGQTAVGIQAAARIFFNKPASQLKLPEAAMLAGLPQAPSEYNPFLDPARAMKRRNDVLNAMAKQGYIQTSTALAAMQKPLGVQHSQYYSARREGYFFDYVKDRLIKAYGLAEVRRGGLRIDTTINLKLQRLARQAIANRLGQPGDPASALVSIDPRNGHIVAMASSSSYGDSKFNLAAQAHRQAGSTFKVMTLMAAIRQGVDPNKTTYDSKPLKFVDQATGTPIDVQTDDKRYGGRTTLFEGLVKSDNTVYQQLDLDIGPDKVRQTAYDMGITSKLDAYPAEGLGGLRIGVSPLEMARAYATIASGGYRLRPVAITKVQFSDGRVSTRIGRPGRVKVFTDGQTMEAIKAMQANVQRGTGTQAQFGCNSTAGKTGTTTSFTDAWFDGMVPNLTTAVTSVHGIEVFGGTFPAQIWHDFMLGAIGSKCEQWPAVKEPFVSAPFFGKYSTTGAPGPPGVSTGSFDQTTGKPSVGPTTTTGKGKGNGGAGKGNGNKKYPSALYQAPPQGAPKTKPPPAVPAPAPAAPPATPGGGAVAPTGQR